VACQHTEKKERTKLKAATVHSFKNKRERAHDAMAVSSQRSVPEEKKGKLRIRRECRSEEERGEKRKLVQLRSCISASTYMLLPSFLFFPFSFPPPSFHLLPRPTCELYSQCPTQCYRQKRRCHQEPAQRCAKRVGNVVKPEEGRGVGEGGREEESRGRRVVRAGHFKKDDGHYEALESDTCRLEYCRENCRVRDRATPSSPRD